MKKLNGITIFWFFLAVVLTVLLIGGINGISFDRVPSFSFSGNGNISYNNGKGEKVDFGKMPAEYVFDAKDVEKIAVHLTSENITVETAKGDTVEVFIKYSNPQNNTVVCALKNSELTIENNYKVRKSIVNTGNTSVLVKIPENFKTLSAFSIENVSGRISADGINAKKLKVSNTSGKIELNNCKTTKIDCGNISGSTKTINCSGELKIESVSGSVQVASQKLDDDIKIESISGGITLLLGAESSFTADFETVGGKVTSDFTMKGKKEGTIYAGDKTYNISIGTVSGKIEVLKN